MSRRATVRAPALGAASIGAGVGLILGTLPWYFPTPVAPCNGCLASENIQPTASWYVPFDILVGIGALMIALGGVAVVRAVVRKRTRHAPRP
jgi:hypothetical protein